jgi:hypothetical protein
MKITDTGLKHILSLGLSKPTETAGVYYLYHWKDIDYYCGPESLKGAFDKSQGVYITLTTDQLSLLNNKPPKEKSLIVEAAGGLSKILDLYETALLLELDEESGVFSTVQCSGLYDVLRHFKLSPDAPSPIKIVSQTHLPFHGFIAKEGAMQKLFEDLGVKTDHLWMTLYPVVFDGLVENIIVGITEKQEYGTDSLQKFKELSESFSRVA